MTCLPTNDTPAGAVKMLLVSFATQDTATLAQVLADDYRFRSEKCGTARCHEELDRAAQLDSVTRLPSIENQDPNSFVVPALSIFGEFPDTSAGESLTPTAGARRRIVLDAFAITQLSDAETRTLVGLTPCVFDLVRGDSAQVPPGQLCDTRHWYVTQWFVGSEIEHLRAESDLGAPQRYLGTPISSLQLGVRRISPLGEWPITLEITLPEPTVVRIELFDLAGRKVLSRWPSETVAGIHHFQMDAPRLSAGIYWLRVSQGNRRVTEKLVVLH